MPVRLTPAVLLLTLGCGSTKIVPVSGRVTLDGRPLVGAHVVFQPIATGGEVNPGCGSYGITDADGRFTLRIVDSEQPGAYLGEHRVEITVRDPTGDDDTDRRGRLPSRVVIPPRYNRASELTCKVPPGGTNAADFELATQP